MSDTTTPAVEVPTLTAGQRIAVRADHDSEFASLRGTIVYPPDENNPGAVVRVDYPGHALHGWTLDTAPEQLVTAGKLLDSRYVLGRSEHDDDLTDEDWFDAMGPSPELLTAWNGESITGGIAEGTPTNATVDDERVIAVYVEDHQSDEYARMFECFYFDGTVDYVAEDEIELDDAEEA